MRLLLDTHTLLWFQSDDPKLSVVAKTAIEDVNNERWLSPISLLEIAPLEAQHIEPLTTMPLHHKDPFDRLNAATALVEQMRLVSVDPLFDSYGVARLW